MIGPFELLLFLLVAALLYRSRHAVLAWIEDREAWQLAALGVLVSLIGVTLTGLPLAPMILMVVGLGFVLLWLREFVFLMRQSDTTFPGRHDKLVWGLVMVFLAPIGALAFWSYRKSHLTAREKPEPIVGLQDWP